MLEELRRHREMVQERIQKSFESDGLDLNILKSENGEIFKAQETEEQEASVTDLIKAGVLEYDDSIEKAVYADTPQNRKLGRVGQEYHRGKGKKMEEPKMKKEKVATTDNDPKYRGIASKTLKDMEESHLFNGHMEGVIDKYFGKELEKKYGSSDFADILEVVGDDKINAVIGRLVKRIPKQELYEIYHKYWDKYNE